MVLGCFSRKLNGVPHCPNSQRQSLKGAPREDKPTNGNNSSKPRVTRSIFGVLELEIDVKTSPIDVDATPNTTEDSPSSSNQAPKPKPIKPDPHSLGK